MYIDKSENTEMHSIKYGGIDKKKEMNTAWYVPKRDASLIKLMTKQYRPIYFILIIDFLYDHEALNTPF